MEPGDPMRRNSSIAWAKHDRSRTADTAAVARRASGLVDAGGDFLTTTPVSGGRDQGQECTGGNCRGFGDWLGASAVGVGDRHVGGGSKVVGSNRIWARYVDKRKISNFKCDTAAANRCSGRW
jgi:hypothetical protein